MLATEIENKNAPVHQPESLEEFAELTKQILQALPTREFGLDYVNRICSECNVPTIPVKQYPLQKGVVEGLACNLGYLCGESSIKTLLRANAIPQPTRNKSGHTSWYPEHVASFLASLESRQRWVPFHPFHDKKKSKWDRWSERWDVGLDPYDNDVEKWPLRALLKFLACDNSLSERDAAFRAVTLKLESMGVVLDAGYDDQYYRSNVRARRYTV